MKAPVVVAVTLLTVLPSFGQYSARTLTRRIAPQVRPAPQAPRRAPATPAPAATPPAQQRSFAPGVPLQPVPSTPADPAQIAAEKKKTESDLIKYYRQRAEAGSDNAQYELGLRYFLGNGVEKDEKLGRQWIAKSAKQGNIKAVKKLEEIGAPEPDETEEAKAAEPDVKSEK